MRSKGVMKWFTSRKSLGSDFENTVSLSLSMDMVAEYGHIKEKYRTIRVSKTVWEKLGG